MHVYIRHGNDEKKSNYKHDKSLNSLSDTETDIINFTKKLIKKYGYPDRIYCSPFKRARATLTIMLKVLDKDKVDVHIEPNLSRFFTKNEQKNVSVRKHTLIYNPPIYENKKSFHKRVDKVQKDQFCTCCNVWYITHYLVLKRMCENKNIAIPNHMKFLWHTVIN